MVRFLINAVISGAPLIRERQLLEEGVYSDLSTKPCEGSEILEGTAYLRLGIY